MDNKTCLGLNNKQQTGDASVTSLFSETKGFFCFPFKQKISKRCRLQNWVFLHTLFLENEAQINQKNYRTKFFLSKQVSLPKISLILQKMKIGQKSDIRPFCTKAFNLCCNVSREINSYSPANGFELRVYTVYTLFMRLCVTSLGHSNNIFWSVQK